MRLRRLRRRLGAVLFVCAAAAGVTLVFAWWLARTPPSWWRGDARAAWAHDPALGERAQALENGVVSIVSQPRPADDALWSILVRPADATAWLNERLPRWLLARASLRAWPAEVRRLQVRFDGPAIEFAALLAPSPDATGRVLTARVTPSVDAQGRLWVRATHLGVGRLPLPRGLALSARAESVIAAAAAELPDEIVADPRADDLRRTLAGQRPLLQRASLRLADGRRVRLVDIRCHEGNLLVTCATEPAATPDRKSVV